MKQAFLIFLAIGLFSFGYVAKAHEDHEHGNEERENIGPGKGIISASEEEGIQISPQAEKNFGIERQEVISSDPIEIPKSAVITTGMEINVYRYRKQHYQRIDIDIIKKSGQQVLIKSRHLKPGDEIVIRGMGLLRIAELAAFGGAPESHSH